MPVRFVCPNCKAKLTVSRRFAGQQGSCPSCQSAIVVPGNPPAAVEAAPILDPTGTADIESVPVAPKAESAQPEVQTTVEPPKPEAPSKSSWLASSVASPSLSEHVQLRRWVVYLQAAMLGISATTFFVFGMLVGRSTAPAAMTGESPVIADVSGVVLYRNQGIEEADAGAVVMLLPVGNHPNPRPEPDTIVPERFAPLNNPAIDTIRDLGGNIVRVDRSGRFETRVRTGSYWLLVLSRNQSSTQRDIERKVRADIGDYFLPVEDLLGNRAFHWEKVRIATPGQVLSTVVF